MSKMSLHAPSGLDQFEDHTGERRVLASIPSFGKMKAALPNYRAAGNPIISRKDRKALNRRAIFGSTDWVLNQMQLSSCVGNGWAGALRRARVLAGQPDVKLSPGFWYSLMNGNQDNGAVISDGVKTGMEIGTCSYALVGESPIYQRNMPAGAKAEAARFRIKAAYHCASWDELASALVAVGTFIPLFGFQVGNSFENFDRYGVAGHSRGPGNHCVLADDLAYLDDGREVMDTVNSWGYGWVPFKNGRFYLDEEHLFGGGDEADVCVVEYAIDDPNAPGPPVVQP
jgi:hypothetical protein